MEPRNQDCLGLYGFGNGYYAREGRLNARISSGDVPAFCNRCPAQTACWEEHKRRVKEAQPEAVEQFEQLLAQNPGRGGQVAIQLMQKGRPDPWMAQMLQNFEQGAKARG